LKALGRQRGVLHYTPSSLLCKTSVNLYCVHPDFAKTYQDWLGDETVNDSLKLSILIQQYINTHELELRNRGITIDLIQYQTFPPIHGIMLGNGALFIAYSVWGFPRSSLMGSKIFFEFFSANDNSPRAQAYRQLFCNWLAEVRKLHKESAPLSTLPQSG
jgi:hypothetical protein